jgi:hypothetical protein
MSTTADASSILLNGSFETPVVPGGGGGYAYVLASSGTTFDGWTAIGSGEVAIISDAFAFGGFTFPAQDGAQWLDLTGSTNTTAGIQQTVATTTGNSYLLSFWVGNLVAPGDGLGSSSAVQVDLNGAVAGLFANTGGSTTQTWQQFVLPFVATSGQTTVAFINQDPSSDGSNGLDNVSLEAVGPTVVPEPASMLLFGTGLVFSARRWRKRRPKTA